MEKKEVTVYYVPKNTPKKRGFTDKLYLYNIIFVTAIVVASFILMFISINKTFIDLTPLAVIVPAAFAELGVHTGFIIWKAKAENERKYGNDTTGICSKNQSDDT